MDRTAYALLLLTFLIVPAGAEAATRTWSGATSGNWGTGSNWVGGVAPVAGDSLIFPAGATTKAMTNNLGNGFSVAAMTFDPGFTLAGNSVALGSGGITCAGAGTTSASVAIALAASVDIDVSSGCELELTGTISGAFDITKTGTGLLRLSGANTYSKITTINGGYVVAASAGALGTGDGTAATGTVVNTGGTLNVSANIANEAVVIHGQGQSNNGVLQCGDGGPFTLGGPVTLGDSNVTMSVLAGRELVFGGAVGGSGRLGISGGGVFTLANTGNSFSGTTSLGGSATLKLGASDVIPDATTLVFTTGSGIFDLNNFDETIAGITGSVNVRTRTSSALTINQAGDASFSGRFYDSGIVVKTGAGRLTLPFEQFITGTVSAFGGTLIVDTTLPSSVTVAPGGVLGGSGTIGQLVFATGGTIAPGSSAGVLSTGPLTMSSITTLAVELNGTTPGTGYDQVNATGTVSLGNSTLLVSPGFAAPLGTGFKIINNDGADQVVGTFAGLAEGATVSAGGQSFAVSYVGGDGNDVVLTAVVPVPTVGVPGAVVIFLSLALLAVWSRRRMVSAPVT